LYSKFLGMKQLNFIFLNDLNIQLRHNSWDFQVQDTPKFKSEKKNKFFTLAPGSGKKLKNNNDKK